MNVIRWQPFTELMSLGQAIDKVFEDDFIPPRRFLGTFAPGAAAPVDMYQTANDVMVKVALPGVKPDEVDISIADNTLTVKGETKVEEEVKREDYIHREHRYGAFGRSVTLPTGLDTDKAEATFEDGILTLAIPKAEETKPKKIKVKARDGIKAEK